MMLTHMVLTQQAITIIKKGGLTKDSTAIYNPFGWIILLVVYPI